jgi:hypothetical protein
VVAAVLGVVFYRVSVYASLLAYGGYDGNMGAISMTTSATAALINLVIIILLNKVKTRYFVDSIGLLSCDVFPGLSAQKDRFNSAISFSYNLSSTCNNQIYEQKILLYMKKQSQEILTTSVFYLDVVTYFRVQVHKQIR